MINSDKAFGMVPEDLLVASAIAEAIEDIRKKPWLLDFTFNWLYKDHVSNKFYGDAEKKAAIDWFNKNKIFVSPSTLREDQIVFPLVTVGLQQATEDIATLGDVHYETTDYVEPEQIAKESDFIVIGPMDAMYSPATGEVTLPSGFSTELVFTGQRLYDSVNKKFYAIKEITGTNSFKIDENQPVNLTQSMVVPEKIQVKIQLESVEFKQQYIVRCFVQNEPKHLMYLSTIIRFILLRYKEKLLEFRGFQRSVVSQQGPYEANNMFGVPEGEFIYGQNLQLTGFVREYWPKDHSTQDISGFSYGLKYKDGTQTPESLLKKVEEQGWWQENDPLPDDEE